MYTVVIAFAVLEEQTNFPRGSHTIALLNTTENYEDLFESLQNIRDEIDQLHKIKVDHIEYEVELFLAADWKFLALIVGIESASANLSCIWCTCHAQERHNSSKTWSITDKEKGARTIEQIQRLAKLKKRGSEKFGCIRAPLFPSISIDHVIPDILHMFLRICDVLIYLLIMELRRIDGIDKSTLRKFDRSTASQIVKYEKFLNEDCKISFHMYLDKESKSLKWRDLRGPEKHKLFKEIDIEHLFPRVPSASNVNKLWKIFLQIYNLLRSTTNVEIESFKALVNEWQCLFSSTYQSKHITPYIHLLVDHMPEFLQIYSTLSPFSQQGLEKLNDDLTKYYFRSTNHRDKDALRQMLLKLNRIEELTDTESFKRKQAHHCKVYHENGHNSRTCNMSLPLSINGGISEAST